MIILITLLSGCHQGDNANKANVSKQAAANVTAKAAPAQQPSAQMSAMMAKANKLIRDNMAQLFSDHDAIVIGNPNGAVTLVEFYDYQCHHCRNMASIIIALTKQNPDLRVVLRQLPFMNRYSVLAAKSALAAETLDPTKFVHFHELLMQSPLPFGAHTLPQVAKAAGYDSAELFQLSQKPQYNQMLQVNRQLATALLVPTIGQLATPVTIIGPTDSRNHYAPVSFIPGFYQQPRLQMAIDAAKNGVCTTSHCG
ncbi:MAG: DsbA family protein [Gammaproteobacteria bacterium]|nr:DsbA family protein [Gammaproteobacteria bacterium]MCP4475949.1 DsbA family protein [Gammaproteobacteria bacterium]